MTLPRLALRNAAQLYFCLAGSALLNVRSQAVFAHAAPDARDLWLSATLLVGAVASALGVSAARARGDLGGVGGVALAALTAAMFTAALGSAHPLYFALDCVALRFVMQYGTQALDRAAVAHAGVAHRRANDLVGLAMRFGGMLLGPLWLGLAGEPGAGTRGVALALGALAAWSAWSVADAPAATLPTEDRHAPHTPANRALLWSARTIYAAFYLLASSAIYVLGDLHRLTDAARRGGLLVTSVYGSAVLATAFAMARGGRRRAPTEMLAAPLCIAVVGLALGADVAAKTWAQALGGVCLGACFARFLLAFRDHATHEALHRGRPGLLADYNNLANTSAVLGYAVMALLALGSRAAGLRFAATVGPGVAALGLAAAPLLLLGARRLRAEGAR